jgi:hypothetical protein
VPDNGHLRKLQKLGQVFPSNTMPKNLKENGSWQAEFVHVIFFNFQKKITRHRYS